MQRGVGKRTIFETRRDRRRFLALVAKAVRRGDLEIHAYCLMDNHFHLLVRSPAGRLSAAMQRILNAYARYFNRTRYRDGPLFKGRFRSKPVETMAYRRTLVRYIDGNPAAEGLVASAHVYEWSSLRHYLAAKGPPWLCRSWVEAETMGRTGSPTYRPADYGTCFGSAVSAPVRALIERRLMGPCPELDELDEVIGSKRAGLRRWLDRRTFHADGTRRQAPLLPPELVEQEVRRRVAERPGWTTRRGHRRLAVNAARLALPGLLRGLCRLSESQIAKRLALPRTTVQSRLRAHGEAFEQDSAYKAACKRIGEQVAGRVRCHLDP